MGRVEVLTSVTEIRSNIQRIIKDANECLYLISPYIKIDNEMKMLLEGKGSFEGINIKLVYGKKKTIEPDTKAFLEAMPHIPIHFLKDLHAKCYLNEKMALVTSMNLYDYSMVDNIEMAVFVDTNNKGILEFVGNPTVDSLFTEIRNKAEDIIRRSQVSEAPKALQGLKEENNTPYNARVSSKKTSKAKEVVLGGHCIRCGEGIAFDPGRPFCAKDLRTWDRFKNEKYEENYCHICGKEKKTSKGKPACPLCYKAHKGFVDTTLAKSARR